MKTQSQEMVSCNLATADALIIEAKRSTRRIGLCAKLSFLLLLLGQLTSGAATEVCGLVENQTWTPAGSPYLVTCDVQVDSLFIQPNVVVQFQSNYVFQVTGFLVATGTVAQPILFTTTNVTAGWQGIFFNQVLGLSELDYCVIEGSRNSGVRIQNCNVEISNCAFRDNSASQGGGINVNNTQLGLGEMTLTGCTFSNNTATLHGGAVRANMGNNSIRFSCCTNLNNTANPAVESNNAHVGGGMYITGSALFNGCLIAGNVVRGCQPTAPNPRNASGGGLYLDGAGITMLKNCVIISNNAVASSCGSTAQAGRGGGAFLGDGTLSMINCIIAFNFTAGTTVDGSGVYVNSGSASLLNCTLAYNSHVGLRAANNSTEVRNSILYWNNSGGTQVTGTTNIFFSCVQNGTTDNNNIIGNPSINISCPDLRITFNSPCKDAGDPDSVYNDVCIDDVNSCAPVSRGTARNDMGAHGGPGACLWTSNCQEGCYLVGPAQATVAYGQNAMFCVTSVGCAGFTYQWWFGGSPISNATNSCHTVTNVQANKTGTYSVVICDGGSTCQTNTTQLQAYPLLFTDINLYPGLQIGGQPGQQYCLQYTTDLVTGTWISLTNFTYTGPEYFYVDRQSLGQPRRFYRVMQGACP